MEENEMNNCESCDDGAALIGNKWVDMCKDCGREREPLYVQQEPDHFELTDSMTRDMLDACKLFDSAITVIAMPGIFSDKSVDMCIDLLRKKMNSGQLDRVEAGKVIDLIEYCSGRNDEQ